MKKIIKKVVLLFFCVYSLFLAACSILAPLSAHFGFYEFSAFLTSILMSACHQQPDRAFWIMGYPMSLCSRCIGFYSGVVIFSLFSLFRQFKFSRILFVVMCLICLTDITINFVLNINTGNILRYVVGLIMGILFVAIINSLFSIKKRSKSCQ